MIATMKKRQGYLPPAPAAPAAGSPPAGTGPRRGPVPAGGLQGQGGRHVRIEHDGSPTRGTDRARADGAGAIGEQGHGRGRYGPDHRLARGEGRGPRALETPAGRDLIFGVEPVRELL